MRARLAHYALLMAVAGMLLAGPGPAPAQTTTHSVVQEHVGAYNALRSGATPTSYTTPTLLNALATLGTVPTLLYLAPATWTITSNVTLPRTITPWFPMGAVLDVAAGMTLSIQGQARIDGCDVFTGSGSVTFGPLVEVDPCWFGAKGNGTTDDTTALQRALVSAGVTSLRLRAGTFLISGTLTLAPGGGSLRGAGHGAFGATKIMTSSPTADMLLINGQGMTISGIQLDSSVTRTGGAGIHIDQAGGASQNTVIERMEILNQALGIYQQRAAGITVRDNMIQITHVDGGGVLIQDTDNNCDANVGNYHNNNILGPGSGGLANTAKGIWHQAGGGLIITNNNVFGFGYAVYISPHPSCTAVALTEFRITSNNLDGFSASALYINATSPLGVSSISVNGNNMAPIFGAGTETIVAVGNVGALAITGGNVIGAKSGGYGIHMFSDGTTAPFLNYIGGNILIGQSASVGISLAVGSTTLEENVLTGFNTPLVLNGVTVHGGVFTRATLPDPAGIYQGSEVVCLDCGPTSATDATCSAGAGRKAFRASSGWICP